MSTLWANFIKTHNQNAGNLTGWLASSPNSTTVRQLGQNMTAISLVDNSAKISLIEECYAQSTRVYKESLSLGIPQFSFLEIHVYTLELCLSVRPVRIDIIFHRRCLEFANISLKSSRLQTLHSCFQIPPLILKLHL
jgi:hypothetical protein